MTTPRPSDARAFPARASGRASAIAPAPATATGTHTALGKPIGQPGKACKPVTIQRPPFASRLNPGPATNVAPLAPPYSATARLRWARAARHKKGRPRSAKTKPSRLEDSLPDSTQAPLHPGAPLALLVARWRCLPKPAKGQPRRPKRRPKRRRATLKCPPASPSACAARKRGTSK